MDIRFREIIVIIRDGIVVYRIPVFAVLLYDIKGFVRELYERFIIVSLLRNENSAYRCSERDIHIIAHKPFCVRLYLQVHIFGKLLDLFF